MHYIVSMATVALEDVNKVYDNGFHAIHDLSIEIADSEFLVLVGPSGCGKSTALRMVAGLETITAGKLLIGDRVVNDVQPKDRDIAMVFQNYALYPHMTVADNIGFALKLARVPKDEIRDRVKKAAAVLELEPYLDRKPGQLSGGQRQRVAMGRAIVRQPSAFLMDEPLDGLPMVVAEAGDDRGQFLVTRLADRSIEQAERLQPGFHLIHGRGTLSPRCPEAARR